MQAEFYAMMHRMRYIQRWSLMRNSSSENLMEHSFEVAVLAHALASIRRQFYYEEERYMPEPERCAVYALFHDAPEILTGDLPTPVKYANPDLRRSFGDIEREAGVKLLSGLPRALQGTYKPYLLPELRTEEEQEILRLVKAADTLSALIKCLDEAAVGNREFAWAEASCREKLKQFEDLPELDYFLYNCLPAYALSLDELQEQKD